MHGHGVMEPPATPRRARELAQELLSVTARHAVAAFFIAPDGECIGCTIAVGLELPYYAWLQDVRRRAKEERAEAVWMFSYDGVTASDAGTMGCSRRKI